MMALGDWLRPDAPTERARLRADLQAIEVRLEALEASGGGDLAPIEERLAAIEAVGWMFLTTEPPAPDLGKDGDSVWDLTNGNIYARVDGAWMFQGAVWLDRSGVPEA